MELPANSVVFIGHVQCTECVSIQLLQEVEFPDLVEEAMDYTEAEIIPFASCRDDVMSCPFLTLFYFQYICIAYRGHPKFWTA